MPRNGSNRVIPAIAHGHLEPIARQYLFQAEQDVRVVLDYKNLCLHFIRANSSAAGAKSESGRPNTETNPKPESSRKTDSKQSRFSVAAWLGLFYSDFLRISSFGFRILRGSHQ